MPRHVTQVEKDLMWELYQNGHSFTQIAKIMGRGRDTVSRYVREQQVAIDTAKTILEATK